MLTNAQLVTLKNDITVTKANVVYNGQTLLQWWNGGADGVLAEYYNVAASPAVQLWRPDLGVDEIKKAINWADYVALSPNGSLKQSAYLALTQGNIVDATNSGIRSAFVAIFGAGSATATALSAIAKRPATNFEVLYSTTENGANVSTVYGTTITPTDIAQARAV